MSEAKDIERPAYYVVVKGRGYWQPTARMKRLGFNSVPCGADGPKAWAVAEEWNARWQESRRTTDTRLRPSTHGFVYFLRQGDLVKIGFSRTPARRLHGLQVGSALKVDSFITVRGKMSDEQQLHRRLAAFRRHGEWFTLAEPVRRIIMRAAMFGLLPTLSVVQDDGLDENENGLKV